MVSLIINPPRTSSFGLRSFNVSFFTAMRCGIMPTSCLVNSRWRRKVFSVGPREYVWLDVFLAAMLRGEWRQFERQLGEGLACLAAAADPLAAWPDDRQIEEAANTFRYERDLITSDETISWLDRAGLTMDAWTDYLVRRLLRDRLHDGSDGLPQRHSSPVTVEDVDFAAEGLCSGAFDRFGRVLAGRAAAGVGPEDARDDGIPGVEHVPVDRLWNEHAVWLDALPPGEVSERVMHLARLESAFRARARAAATDHALASQVARHRLEWTRVDLERVSFDTADAAREAVCCVRDDGLTLTDVAIESRRAVRDTRDLLERIEPELRDVVLCASVDELVGPVAVGPRHEVVCVVDRRPADLADPLVRARADAAAVDQMIAGAILTHVRWAERPRS
jgi:hypothetical protein